MRFHRCYKILVKHLRQTANSYHHPSLVAKVQHMLLQFLNSQNWNQKFSKTCDISQLPSNAVILFTKYHRCLKRTNFSNKYSSNDNLSPPDMCLFFERKRMRKSKSQSLENSDMCFIVEKSVKSEVFFIGGERGASAP